MSNRFFPSTIAGSLALLLTVCVSAAAQTSSTSIRVLVTRVNVLSTASSTPADCLALGGAYLTLGFSRLLRQCPAEIPAAATRLPFLISTKLPAALPAVRRALPSTALGDSTCKMVDPALSAWKKTMPGKNVRLCTTTFIPD